MATQTDRKYTWHREYDPDLIPFVLHSESQVVFDRVEVMKEYERLLQLKPSEKQSQTIIRFLKHQFIPEWGVDDEPVGLDESVAEDRDTILVGRWRLQAFGGLVLRVNSTADKLVLAERCDMTNSDPISKEYHDPAVWAYAWQEKDHSVVDRLSTRSLGLSGPRRDLATAFSNIFKKSVDYYKDHNPT